MQWVLLPTQTDDLIRNIYGWRGEAMHATGYLMLVEDPVFCGDKKVTF